MHNLKGSPLAAGFARKLMEDQFVYAEEPAEPRPTLRERLANLSWKPRFSIKLSPARTIPGRLLPPTEVERR
jgi:hypothetical protein